MREGIPKGWIETTIPAISLLNPKSDLADDLNIGFSPMALVPVNFSEKLKFEKRTWGAVKRGFTHFKDDDVIFAKITPCFENSKAAIVSGLPNACGAGSTEYFVLRPMIVPPGFLFYWVKTTKFLKAAEAKMTGSVGQKRVPKAFVQSYPLPLPPLNEQKRIVAKLDKIIPRIDSVKTRLDKIPVLIKRFRQAVLTAAVTGRLTEKWRGEHPEVESAGIGAPSDTNSFYDTWRTAEFNEIILELRNGISLKPNINPPGTKILRISANRSGFVNLEDCRYITKGTAKYSQYLLKEGDLLFTRYNGNVDLVGVCGKVRNLQEQCLYPDKLMRVRVNQQVCEPNYIEFIFQTGNVRDYISSKSKTSAGQNGLSGKDLKLTPIPLPPLAEQHEIVHQVNKLFSLADKLESHYQKAKSRTDKLSQSVLAKAFRGELVPQDPNDEPAEKLLARILEEKKKLASGVSRKRGKTK
jgi:type I restriction enzyme S subunit